MATAGPNAPGTMADDATVGSYAWSNVNNAKVSDNAYATAGGGAANGVGHYLKATNFGFSIPSGSTITGITVNIERKSSRQTTDNIKDSAVRIVKADGTIGTTNKGDTTNSWVTTDTVITYGSSADLWGETWAYTDINDVDFGVVIAPNEANVVIGATASVDFISITVDYTTGTDYPLTATQQSYALTGKAAAITSARTIAATQRSYSLTGQAVAFKKAFAALSAAFASFSLTGIATAFKRGLGFAAVQASFALTGQAVSFVKGFGFAAQYASFVLTGIVVGLRPSNIWTNSARDTTTFANASRNTTSFSATARNTTSFSTTSKNTTIWTPVSENQTTFTNQSKS